MEAISSMGGVATMWEFGSARLAPVYVTLVVVSVLWVAQGLMRRKNLPPSPPGLPVIGHLHLLDPQKPLHQIFASLAQKCGPLMTLRLGSVRTLVISSPKMVQECLRDNDKVFCGRPYLTLITSLTYDGQDVVMARRTTPEWRQLKKVSVVELHSQKRLTASSGIRETEIASMLKGVLHDCTQNPDTPIQLREKLFRMNFNIISMTALKKRYLAEDFDVAERQLDASTKQRTELVQAVQECFVVAGMVCLQDCFPVLKYFKEEDCVRRMKRIHNQLDAYFQTIIDEHKAKRAQKVELSDSDKDMVDVLLEAGEFTDLQIKATLMNTYLGATESVIVPMEWAMTEAIRNPKIMERARAELDKEVGRNRMCTEADVPKLHYIRAIVTETMRLHPSAPLMMPRETTADCRIAGYDILANTRVLVNTYAIGRDPANWEDPLLFNPDRFMDREANRRGGAESEGQWSAASEAANEFRMMPFGTGRRLCPGVNMGMAVVYLAVANMLHCFDWSATPDALDLSEAVALTNPKRVPLRATVRPRLPAAVFSSTAAAA